MKNLKYCIGGILFIFMQQTTGSNPDEWSGPRESILLSHWSINLNIGCTSYFGDLSQYDLKPFKKLFNESKLAYGLKLSRQIRFIKVSGQVNYGGFKSNYKPENSFKTSMLEYSIQTGINILPFIFKQRLKKYGFEVYVGIGQFIFNTSVNNYNDGQQTASSYSTGVPEFIYFFGSELSIYLAKQVWFTADLAIRQVQNDNMDKYIAKGDFDYYSLFNIGVTYYFGKLYRPFQKNTRKQVNRGRPHWR